MNSNKLFFFLNIVIVILVVIVGVALAWTNPTDNPPSGSGVLYYSGGNVGIGMTTPSQKLDVYGQIHATGDICIDTGGGKCLSTAGGAASFGGLYEQGGYGNFVNPVTGGYSCPTGYSNVIVMQDIDMDLSGNIGGYLHLCYKL